MIKLNRLTAILLTFALALSLAACGKNADTATDAKGQPIKANTSGSVGSIMLIGENRVTVFYDKKGEVVAIADTEGNAVYDEFKNKACATAVSDLLKKADPPIVVNTLLIRQAANSQNPSENFLQDIAKEAEIAVNKLPVVLCRAEDLNDLGYFSPETAKKVLAAYLGNPANATYTASDNMDGYYEATVTIDGRIDTFSIGAYYGRIELISGYGEPPIEEETHDYFVDDGTNMNITDNPEAEIFE